MQGMAQDRVLSLTPEVQLHLTFVFYNNDESVI